MELHLSLDRKLVQRYRGELGIVQNTGVGLETGKIQISIKTQAPMSPCPALTSLTHDGCVLRVVLSEKPLQLIAVGHFLPCDAPVDLHLSPRSAVQRKCPLRRGRGFLDHAASHRRGVLDSLAHHQPGDGSRKIGALTAGTAGCDSPRWCALTCRGS